MAIRLSSRSQMQTVRLLRWSDAWFCYKLAKDPAVRKASLDSRPPTLVGHVRWMWRWIRDIDRIAWIIPSEGDTVGLVRFDRNSCQIGIAITRERRGEGVALEALLGASPYFWRKTIGCLYAVIKIENKASIDLFRKAGYRILKIRGRSMTMEWEPEVYRK